MTKRDSLNKPAQRYKFIEAARKAEADESETAFEAKLKKIAKALPKGENGRPTSSEPIRFNPTPRIDLGL